MQYALTALIEARDTIRAIHDPYFHSPHVRMDIEERLAEVIAKMEAELTRIAA